MYKRQSVPLVERRRTLSEVVTVSIKPSDLPVPCLLYTSAAGLNPILSATGGNGASTGSVGANTAQGFGNMTSPSEILGLFNNAAQVDNLRANTANQQMNTVKQNAEMLHEYKKIDNTIADTRLKIKQGNLSDQQIKNLQKELEMYEYQKAQIQSVIQLKMCIRDSHYTCIPSYNGYFLHNFKERSLRLLRAVSLSEATTAPAIILATSTISRCV